MLLSDKNERIYFDSYGQITPVEIERHLKTGSEFDRGKEVIQRNTDIVQAASTSVCGHLCLFVLKSLANGEEFQSILNHMQHYGYQQGDWKYSVLFYRDIVSPGPTTHYTYNWTRKIIHCLEMNRTML